MNEELINILEHARNNVPYYQLKFNKIGSFKNKANFKKIPLLSKQDIINNPTQLIAKGYRRETLIEDYTSGSTGTSLIFYRHKRESSKASLLLWNLRRRWVPDITQIPMLKFYAVKIQEGHILNEPFYFENGNVYISLFNLNNDDFHKCWTKIYNMKIKKLWIFGCPSAVFKLASFIKQNKQFHGIVKFIELSGEVVFPEQKEFMKKVFNCPVMNNYGTAELWGIAYEQIDGRLHILDKNVHVEVVDENGIPLSYGEKGEVVVTGLTNYAMPFIRYRVGDLGTIVKNDDSSEVLELHGGRVTDYILTKNGETVNSVLIYFIILKINQARSHVQQFQATQNDLYNFTIKLVLMPSAEKKWVEKIFYQQMKHYLGEETEIKFVYFENLPQGKKT